MRGGRTVALAGCVAAAALACSAEDAPPAATSPAAQAEAEPTAAPAPIDERRLREAAGEPGSWLLHGGDHAEQRFSTLDQAAEAQNKMVSNDFFGKILLAP